MLTTAERADKVTKQKPGGVDRIDQLLESYDATRKTVRWYLKLAIHLIQISILNGWTLYKHKGGKFDFYKFSRNVVAKLVFRDAIISTPENENLSRLTGRHFIFEIPPTEKKLRPQKRCRVCYQRKVRRDIRFYCLSCPSQPGLCLGECFQRYHTKEAYWE
ncbi:hypothetical protein RRG08_038796 [Elysia crispata]|uniref:PiggyBac transposable element-derived protein domain-containing protein n=1 Tax=Elysia crispata TaxID=231223 RepID=A0AAE1D4V6_9GAST|nr:hypothetical protein RRG08_038796 [Elysia crispata]